MKKPAFLLVIIALLLLVQSVWAMSSTSYQLDWFTPITGSGGARASSTHYTGRITAGQTATGNLSSPGYTACLGFWCSEHTRVAVSYDLFLPMISRGAP
jgi:hypothetical protein